MYTCYVCAKSEASIAKFRAHLHRHHVVGELTYPLLCCDCKGHFSKIYNFMRHVRSFHNSLDEAGIEACGVSSHNTSIDMPARHVQHGGAEDVDGCNDDMEMMECSNDDVSEICVDLRVEGISLVAGLRANSSIPFSVVPEVVQSFNHMSNSLVSLVQAETLNCLKSSGVDSNVIKDVKLHLDEKLKGSREPLEFLSSRYKQDSFFDGHKLAVKPETVDFGTNFSSQSGNSRLVYESFQYVPVKKTLQTLMQNRAFVEMMLEDKCVPGVLQEFVDGDKFKTHSLFSDSSKFSIIIQLFYDGLGVTNPLRGNSTLHNIGVFFYTIKNIPHRFNTCFANVHLLALCYSEDLKKYGFEPVLEEFVAEMNFLSNTGFAGNFPVIGEQTIFASLGQVTCDNLALNGILGFIESFSCDYFCSICYASQQDIQVHFREEFFQKRGLRGYGEDVRKLRQGTSKKNHIRGVKTDCVLNKIDDYHVTDNWSLDIMHVVLEGIIPLELGCILYSLCIVDKAVGFESLTCELEIFWGKLTVDKSHKPMHLTKLTEPGQGLAPTMKAVQYWTLLKYLPLVLGNFVSPGNKHWRFLLHLSHLVDLLFAPRFTQGMVHYMRSVVEDHLSQYIYLYGHYAGVRIRPKHHFLIHLPSIILKSGPLVGMSCLRYELKNSFFKRSAHIVCNFTNICRTLAYRHQQRFLFSLLSSDHCRRSPVVYQQQMVLVSSLPFCNLLCDKLGLVHDERVSLAVKLCVATVEYKQGNYIVVDAMTENGNLVFGKIVKFVSCSHNADWYIVVESLTTLGFWEHFHAYCICDLQPVSYRLLALSEMVDHHPLHCHSSVVNNTQQQLIRAPYHIFKP